MPFPHIYIFGEGGVILYRIDARAVYLGEQPAAMLGGDLTLHHSSLARAPSKKYKT